MTHDSSKDLDVIAEWLERLRDGDARAADVIWDEYFSRLVRLAERRMRSLRRRSLGEEDVALSAMKSFLLGAQQGKYPDVKDGVDLWKLLVVMTARKIVAHQRRNNAQKRGGGRLRGESVFFNADDTSRGGMNEVLGSQPSPELATEFAETFEDMLDRLDDQILKTIVVEKLEGFTNREIAQHLDCTERTIERKLERIRVSWSEFSSLTEA